MQNTMVKEQGKYYLNVFLDEFNFCADMQLYLGKTKKIAEQRKKIYEDYLTEGKEDGGLYKLRNLCTAAVDKDKTVAGELDYHKDEMLCGIAGLFSSELKWADSYLVYNLTSNSIGIWGSIGFVAGNVEEAKAKEIADFISDYEQDCLMSLFYEVKHSYIDEME